MKLILFGIFSILMANIKCQNNIDTVVVYNVHGVYDTTEYLTGFGGPFTEFHRTKKCPFPKDKYIKAFNSYSKHVESNKLFWIKLYDINDILLYEGLKQANCNIGAFISYYENGNIKTTGDYNNIIKDNGNPLSIKPYVCSGEKVKIWIYYKPNGEIKKELIK